MATPQPSIHPHYVRSEELGIEITELCAYINAATHELLLKIHEFDRDKLWALIGICSCAHWLNYRCGIGMNAAREKVRVANALAELPLISESFSKGEISYSKVRAMTRVATTDNEDFLLNIAHHGTAHHMERTVSQFRRVVRRHESHAAAVQFQDRSISYYYDDDGSLVIKGRLPAEQGAMMIKALQLALDAHKTDVGASIAGDKDVTAEIWEPIDAKRADALAKMAESYLAHGTTASSSAERYQVMVHVSAETLKSDKGDKDNITAVTPTAERDHISHIEDGPHVTAETSRRICCDSSISPLITDINDEPQSIGRKSRTIPPPMRRALQARDKGCRFPGCTHRYFIDGHHIKHWADGGETSMNNLVLLCRHHHRLVHEGGFGCERSGTGQLVFKDQRGEIIGISGTVPALPTITDNPKAQQRIRNRLEELHLDARTCVTKWDGEPADYHFIIGLLWSRTFPDE